MLPSASTGVQLREFCPRLDFNLVKSAPAGAYATPAPVPAPLLLSFCAWAVQVEGRQGVLGRPHAKSWRCREGAQAVESSLNVTKGNTQLRKALRHSAAARKYMLLLLLVASFGLLFLDWYYSGRLAKPK